MNVRKMLIARGYWDENKGGDGGGGGGGGETPEAKAAREKAESEAAAKAEQERLDKLSKDELIKEKEALAKEKADLLKEVMQKKEAHAAAVKAASEAAAKLKDFEGLDPAEIKKLVKEKKDAETLALEAKGEWDALKKQMNEAHATELQGKDSKINELNTQVGTLNQQIADLTVGGAFGNSRYIADELALTPSKVRTIYGSHFEFSEGKVVAFDKPAGTKGRSMLVDGKGEPLGFEDAIKKIVDTDPDKETVLKSKLKQGAGSGSGAGAAGARGAGGNGPGAGTMTSREKIAAGLKDAAAAKAKQ